MSSLPQRRHCPPRPIRVRPAEFTPAVLRFPNGGCTPGELQLFSLSGGLLGVPRPLNQGAHVKLMFLTETGPVLGEAELLRPISWTAQPFRFVSLREGDQHRLQTAIQPLAKGALPDCEPRSTLENLTQSEIPALGYYREEEWINKYRAAKVNRKPSRKRLVKMFFGAVTFATIFLGAIYFFSFHIAR